MKNRVVVTPITAVCERVTTSSTSPKTTSSTASRPTSAAAATSGAGARPPWASGGWGLWVTANDPSAPGVRQNRRPGLVARSGTLEKVRSTRYSRRCDERDHRGGLIAHGSHDRLKAVDERDQHDSLPRRPKHPTRHSVNSDAGRTS